MSKTAPTVRDYFAATAPEVPVDYPWLVVPADAKPPRMDRESSLARRVRWRWEWADAMMAGRDQKP